MKKLAILTVVIGFAVSAQAKIGYTLAQCRSEYGKPLKVETAWCGGTAAEFVHNGLFSYIIFDANGKAADITYFSSKILLTKDITPLSKATTEYLWYHNVDKGKVWDNSCPSGISDWDGKREVKKFGNENFKHWVMYERNGPDALIENAPEYAPNKNGYQIRTQAQFEAEQPVIRNWAKNHPKI